ncbi:MAG: 6-carboxytetrahydropterin synthase QueD [Gammaproteobacteria bacterium]|nr:6-carboxytetrahydropterin synthase QueD [Gammaproteobacteria bacterium]
MTASYKLKIVTDFAAAHTLRSYPGNCSRMHGHNWKVEVSVVASHLNDVGMAIDFKEIKRATKTITNELDHRYLNDIKPFDLENPTAENIAAFIYRGVSEIITNNPANQGRVAVVAVTLWETERACVTYSEQQ